MKFVIIAAVFSLAHGSHLYGNHNERIFFGQIATKGQFPYQASIRRDGEAHDCGGSIINSEFILTAAHCFRDYDPEREHGVVVVGTIYRNNSGVAYRISKVIVHEDAHRDGTTMYHNDIALVKVATPIEMTRVIQPIELNTQQIDGDEDLVTSGWGWAEVGTKPYKLRYLKQKSVSHEDCKDNLEKHCSTCVVDSATLCAIAKKGGVCFGDSGGPAVWNGKLAGVTSWTITCYEALPNVYMKVADYIDWIHKNIEMYRTK